METSDKSCYFTNPGEGDPILAIGKPYKRYVRLDGKKTNYVGKIWFYQPNGNIPVEPRGITVVTPYGVLPYTYSRYIISIILYSFEDNARDLSRICHYCYFSLSAKRNNATEQRLRMQILNGITIIFRI